MPHVPRRDRSGPPDSGGQLRVRRLPIRRTALVRAAVWLAVASGPLALVSGFASARSQEQAQPVPVTKATSTTEASAGPAGYAELFLGLWLRAGGSADGPAARQVRAMAPSVPLPVWGERPPAVERLAAVRTARQGRGAWSVTIAVHLKEPTTKASSESGAEQLGIVRYFALPVTVTDTTAAPGGTQEFAIAAAPAEVAGPSAADEPDSPYEAPVPTSSELATTAGEFLTAYLKAGDGGADRYLAPGTTLPALVSAPAIDVSVDDVRSTERTEGTAGADGATARVLAQVTASDADGRVWPLAYALKLQARDGRWEVRAVQSGLETSRDTDTTTSPKGAR
ncbi:conjugal transfer protein [Streptomyces cavernicola]|uniref:Conjugal transfer protein n=1 Tax=Streptomyces cavernicola TaxID=3043613 RepID=A0ABT6SLQ7_9ACTN|nr:conjugal transfer protein [Streptomyces sp. B-S-A6]MDI3408338.1 conjugal transfer protein [Streptomyces sp. B-S-A6]